MTDHTMEAMFDIAIDMATVSDPGNASIGIIGFERPSEQNVPATNTTNDGYQQIGGVAYTFEIGQYEITASQYVAFLNAVDPTGSNPTQPWSGVKLYENRFSPVVNPYQGQIINIRNANDGEHYVLSDEDWKNKPMMWNTMFQYLYFINSLANGNIVAESNITEKSPEGFSVELSKKYVQFSDDYRTGAYDLNDSNYALATRQNMSGFFLPSEDEWVKASYYAGSETDNGTSYYYYPTSTNSVPQPLISAAWLIEQGIRPDAAEFAANVDQDGNVINNRLQESILKNQGYVNYNKQTYWQPDYSKPNLNKANVTDVGGSASPSPWLTYDQGGNLVEWTDTPTSPLQQTGSENLENVPVYFKVHGGIANAPDYQLWLTATGTSNPYGQVLGSMYEYNGARVSYIPDAGNTDLPDQATPSAIADPLTGQGVVTRVDSLNTFDTFYTTSNAQATDALTSDDEYVFMAASFREQSKDAEGSIAYYSFVDQQNQTHYYTGNQSERCQLIANPRYIGGDLAFYALAPGEGSTDFIRYYNSSSGAYGFSAAAGDEQFFTSRGYSIDGIGWSI